MCVEKGIRKIVCLQTFLVHRWSQFCWPETEIFLRSGLWVPLSNSNLKSSPMQYGSLIKTINFTYTWQIKISTAMILCVPYEEVLGGSMWSLLHQDPPGREGVGFSSCPPTLFTNVNRKLDSCHLDHCKPRKAKNVLNLLSTMINPHTAYILRHCWRNTSVKTLIKHQA